MKGLLNGLDLFSGIGGISLGLSERVRTVAYCEADRHAQAVLLSRMQDGELDRSPIWDDIFTLSAEMLPRIDIISAGFPCQPYSSAARGANRPDTTVSQLLRLIKECRPSYIFVENTSEKAISIVTEYCERLGYTCRVLASEASDVGAPFIGRRYWAIAEADSDSKSTLPLYDETSGLPPLEVSSWRDITPQNLRVDDGLPLRLERLKRLGNAVVPAQAREAFKRLMGIK